jgi:hypothetical protein
MTLAMFLLYWPGFDTWFMSIAHLARLEGRNNTATAERGE